MYIYIYLTVIMLEYCVNKVWCKIIGAAFHDPFGAWVRQII